MKIRKGIRIHKELSIGTESISINSGTVLHAALQPAMVSFGNVQYTPKYEENAYLPKKDWRELDPKEIRYLKSSDDRNSYNTVYLGEIPELLVKIFKALKLTSAKDRFDIIPMMGQKPELIVALNEEMGKFLRSLSPNNQFELFCVGANLPNMETIGFNPINFRGGNEDQHKHFMGMHIDRSKVVDIEEVHKLGNRICINLGAEHRYLLFINLSMIQVLEMLKEKIGAEADGLDCTNIAKIFFMHFPDYPVIRVRQEPYQYYIAPTDNCFHDGSSLGKKELDITMVFFGSFQC